MISKNLEPEIQFSASRSSGPGGQHVNKVSTAVELRFNIPESQILDEEEKKRIIKKLEGKLTTEGELIVNASETRSQTQNKKLALEKFYAMIEEALKIPKKRKRTRPSATSRKKRLENKRRQSEKKELRKPPEV